MLMRFLFGWSLSLAVILGGPALACSSSLEDMRKTTERAEELALQMEIADTDNLEVYAEFCVPTKINGVLVPPQFLTEAEREQIQSSRRLQGLMEEPNPTAQATGENEGMIFESDPPNMDAY